MGPRVLSTLTAFHVILYGLQLLPLPQSKHQIQHSSSLFPLFFPSFLSLLFHRGIQCSPPSTQLPSSPLSSFSPSSIMPLQKTRLCSMTGRSLTSQLHHLGLSSRYSLSLSLSLSLISLLCKIRLFLRESQHGLVEEVVEIVVYCFPPSKFGRNLLVSQLRSKPFIY